MTLPAVSRFQFAPALDICRVLNGMWQVSGAHGAIDPERDVQFNLGPADTLDHASRIQDFGSKMGIDATRKWGSEGFARPWPDEILMDPGTKARIDSLWKSFGL